MFQVNPEARGIRPNKRKGTLVSTLTDVAPSPAYPLRFEIKGGPTHSRIADSAKYYHDPDFDMPLTFRGVLTDTRTGQSRSVKLTAYVTGYGTGTDFKDGWMRVDIHFLGYYVRFGSQITYNFRDPKKTKVLELGAV